MPYCHMTPRLPGAVSRDTKPHGADIHRDTVSDTWEISRPFQILKLGGWGFQFTAHMFFTFACSHNVTFHTDLESLLVQFQAH